MNVVHAIEQLRSPHDFKSVVDAVLRLELGPALQSFGASGADGGVDALYEGALGKGLPEGTWVFQYKFTSPLASDAAGRMTVAKRFLAAHPLASEFHKAHSLGPVGYVLITNAAMNPQTARRLATRCAEILPGTRFLVWDRSALNGLLRGREYLARTRDGILETAACERVVKPLHSVVEDVAERTLTSEFTLWPLQFHYQPPRFEGCGILGEIDAAVANPLFARASAIAFPRAFHEFSALRDGVVRLERTVAREVGRVLSLLKAGPIEGIRASTPEHVVMDLTIGTVEGAWSERDYGTPKRREAAFEVGTKQWHFEGASDELLPFVQRVYGEERARGLPAAVRAERERVGDVALRLATQLWYPAELGIDCPEDPLRP